MDNPVGVFDSGVGGLTVLRALATTLPDEDFVYFADCKNAPYGFKKQDEIIGLSRKIIDFLLTKHCKLIVVACNTATAAAVSTLRREYPMPIVGLEPAVKPACLNSKTGHIGVLATEGTFRGNHFRQTSEKYKDYITIHLQIAKGLVEFAERGIFAGSEVENLVRQYVRPFEGKNIDQLVLGCTHYPLFHDIISKIVGKGVAVIDSAEPVARRTKDMLMVNKILRLTNENRRIDFFTSGNVDTVKALTVKLFGSDKVTCINDF